VKGRESVFIAIEVLWKLNSKINGFLKGKIIMG
jgi:hypothetical protein